MQHPIYSIRYSVIPINSTLLNITLYSLVRTALVYDDLKYCPFHYVMNKSGCIKLSAQDFINNAVRK